MAGCLAWFALFHCSPNPGFRTEGFGLDVEQLKATALIHSGALLVEQPVNFARKDRHDAQRFLLHTQFNRLPSSIEQSAQKTVLSNGLLGINGDDICHIVSGIRLKVRIRRTVKALIGYSCIWHNACFHE
ncbi:hypothetical protein [Pseudomonas syringae]|uniref:Uncharacterized protein n=1 Tax=Pseudomonas syringae pv. papulans TaxID=83963 RepID=A0AA43DYS8_PSESX|nr:hypothetical protein [Pseudomonas syringae]KWS33857.1 hypothetical protein AL059_10630 [Pseudomonas syringae pv. papulans]MDH4606781.1 hypothetical protein [Pseudomonas syringae pv. papulans]MDH4625716.1 hypothetical protein [Pseudomonas syringae pv. papulans]RMN72735.1 hypothetical protein ALQ56_200344 [Pseudomonas syringae pv. papulans]